MMLIIAKYYGNFNCGAYNIPKIHPESVIRYLQKCVNQKDEALSLRGKIFW